MIFNSLYKQAIIVFVVLASLIAGYYSWPVPDKPLVSATPNAAEFKVAMLLPGMVDDGGWNQAGYQGLKHIEKELGAQVAYTENSQETPVKTRQILRQYAEAGFDFIILHGGYDTAPLLEVAEAFPRTKFALMGGFEGNNKNFGALSFRAGEISYLAGVAAALKSKSEKIAYIGGMPIPNLKESSVLFERGARSINPEVEVSIRWLGSWNDKKKAENMAGELIEAGADILLGNADLASLGVIDAAKKAGVYAIGVARDQHERAPGTVLTSMEFYIGKLLVKGALLVQQGRWEGTQYKFGLREQVHRLSPFYGLLTPDEEKIVTTVQNDILTGKIDVLP